MRTNLEDYLDGLMTEIIKKRMNESPRPTRVILASTPLGESVRRVFALDPHVVTWKPLRIPAPPEIRFSGLCAEAQEELILRYGP